MSEAGTIASAAPHEGHCRTIKKAAAISAAAFLIAAGSFAAWVVSLGPLPLEQSRKVSTTIVDRNGKLLRAYAMADGRWRLPVDAKTAVDPVISNCCWRMKTAASGRMPASIRWRSGARHYNSAAAATSSPVAPPLRCNWRG